LALVSERALRTAETLSESCLDTAKPPNVKQLSPDAVITHHYMAIWGFVNFRLLFRARWADEVKQLMLWLS
jgi:hypothetical protein